MKILIEFYCDENTKNISPLLYGDYDRVYFIGFDGEGADSRRAEVLDTLISGRFGAETADGDSSRMEVRSEGSE